MGSIDKASRSRAVDPDAEDIAEAINREILPIQSSIRTEINLGFGATVELDDDAADQTIALSAGVVICSNAASMTVYLPAPSLCSDKRITVLRTSATVTVRDADGGDISGSATAALTPIYTAKTFFSNGTGWYVIAAT